MLVLGSTEPHYTPSKVFQAMLSRRPVFAMLHRDSTAVEDVTFDPDAVDRSAFDDYSARSSTRALAAALDLACVRAAARQR